MRWTDEQIDQMLGALLRTGVILAAAIVLLGGVLYVINYGAVQPDYQIFHGEPADLRGVAGILVDAGTFHSRGLIQFGLLLLIATPVARVLFSVVAFALQRDRTYIIVTLIVLGALLYSLLAVSP
ncbi:MAG: DUF1634 domain-containing protein [Caldilineaceae bacterium]